MTVREIVAQWLRDHGYDGLYHDGDCGCLLDDLMPCCDSCDNCEPGYKQPGDGDADFYVGPTKEKTDE